MYSPWLLPWLGPADLCYGTNNCSYTYDTIAPEDPQSQQYPRDEHQEDPNHCLDPMQPCNVWTQHLNGHLYDNNLAPQEVTPVYDPDQLGLFLGAFSNYNGSWPAFPTPQDNTPVHDQVPNANNNPASATIHATKDNQPTGPQSTVDREAELKELIRASTTTRSSTTARDSASSPTGAENRKDDSEEKSQGTGYDGTHEARQPFTKNDIDQLITEEKNKALSAEMRKSSLESGEILAASEGPFTFAQPQPRSVGPTQPISVLVCLPPSAPDRGSRTVMPSSSLAARLTKVDKVQMSRSGDKSHGSTKSPITDVGIMQSTRNAIAQPSGGKSSIRGSREIASPEGPDMTSVPQSCAALDTQKLLPRDDGFVLTQGNFPRHEDHKYIPEWLDATTFYDLHHRKKKLPLYRAKSTADLVAEMPQPYRLHPTKRANLNNSHEFHTSTGQIKPSTKRGISPSNYWQNINEHDRKRSKTNGTSGRPHLKGYNEAPQTRVEHDWTHDARGEYRQNSYSDSFVEPRGRIRRYVNNDSSNTGSYRKNYRKTSPAAPRNRSFSSASQHSPSPKRLSYILNSRRSDSGCLNSSFSRRRTDQRGRFKSEANTVELDY